MAILEQEMADDPIARFPHREVPETAYHTDTDVDDFDDFVDPDDGEDCRAGLLDFDELEDDDM
ncbi:hypothetical protein [Vineibacter terrae]|uniref:hypothetical protein n=1 Tax=Vineibacter terrae TaxID=2586908 RepID=UPI002E2FE519|nr:hypothetical protein [Vineibacter terrae]HEX2889934.1 hypothetical protein [Vineibacter terrae]